MMIHAGEEIIADNRVVHQTCSREQPTRVRRRSGRVALLDGRRGAFSLLPSDVDRRG
jgi:hypothetical protein